MKLFTESNWSPPPHPLDHSITVHPEDKHYFPPIFEMLLNLNGIVLNTNPHMIKGKMCGMGRAAEIMMRIKFHKDVQKAMNENARFLKFMKDNGLA